MWVRSLGGEDPQEEEMTIHSSIRAWKIPWAKEPASCSPWGHKESDTTERPSTQTQVWRNVSFHVHVSQLALDVPPPWVVATTHQGTRPCGHPAPV